MNSQRCYGCSVYITVWKQEILQHFFLLCDFFFVFWLKRHTSRILFYFCQPNSLTILQCIVSLAKRKKMGRILQIHENVVRVNFIPVREQWISFFYFVALTHFASSRAYLKLAFRYPFYAWSFNLYHIHVPFAPFGPS